MRTLTVLTLILFVLGCGTAFSSLVPVNEGSVIQIDETYSYKKVAGLFKETWHIGLVAGHYTATARDELGTYYLGPPHSIILLYDYFGENYLKTGTLPTEKEKLACCHGVWFNDTGGIWIPHNEKEKPKIFLMADYSDDDVVVQADKNITSLAPAALLVAKPTRALLQGRIVWGPEIEDQKLLDQLVVRGILESR